jgi:hypothetical protein
VREEGRLGKSDHAMIVFEVSMESRLPELSKTRPDWAKADWDKARRMLTEVRWHTELQGLNTQEAWESFKSKMEAVIEECVPQRRRRNRNRPPWLSQDILREKKRLWRRDKSKADKTKYIEQDRKTRNMIKKC